MSALPRTLEQPQDGRPAGPLVEVRGLTKLYPVEKGFVTRKHSWLSAVEDLDLTIDRGETLGLVGESGCGKSTVARLVTRLIEPTRGEILYDGRSILSVSGRELRRLRHKIQIVFQDPYSSLNPRHSVRRIISEGIESDDGRQAKSRRVAELLDLVGLTPDVLDRYPHEFSGGQRQRIVIARALAVGPEFLVLDEPVSALDVSIQSQVLNLLVELKHEFNLTYLFVAHDLAVVGYISDRIAVMYLGKVVELATSDDLFARPLHPYTQALLSANPEPIPGRKHQRIVLKGDVPSPIDPPSGCRFRTRCPIAQPICAEVEPPLADHGNAHGAACHFAGTKIPETPSAVVV